MAVDFIAIGAAVVVASALAKRIEDRRKLERHAMTPDQARRYAVVRLGSRATARERFAGKDTALLLESIGSISLTVSVSS